jgi:hypothetical protein
MIQRINCDKTKRGKTDLILNHFVGINVFLRAFSVLDTILYGLA